jgi:hypothetical protein
MERKIVQYELVHSYELKELESRVNRMMAEGWQPHGGVQAYGLDSQHHYVQALVKYDPPI